MEKMFSYALLADNARVPVETEITVDRDRMRAVVRKESVPEGAQKLDFLPDYFAAHEGEEGYMAFPANYLTYFKGHEDAFRPACTPTLYMFGAKTKDRCFVGIQRGAERYDSVIMADIKDGRYTLYPRYNLDGDPPYGDFIVDYFTLTGTDADYSGMARTYRRVRLEEDGLLPLTERTKGNPFLTYAAASPYIRIRLGWKPVPSPVEEQTPENEPPVHVAMTFDRVGEFLDELKRQGVDKAEICLVGWNVGGHDGRYPDVLPVEKTMGGADRLRALIRKAQSMGYSMTCHTNSSDAYSVAPSWDEHFLLRKKNGDPVVGGNWGGGKMYETCPQATYKLSERMLDQVADLGFRGIHYIDVVSVVPPRKCYDPDHPLNCEQTTALYQKIFRYAKGKIGGISSEGGYDYMTDVLDYGLYVTPTWAKNAPFADEMVPLWQIVYNGTILQNPYTNTINAAIKEQKDRLTAVEFCARPTFYIYSKFVDKPNGNWMGEVDLRCDTDEEMRETVARIRETCEDFAPRAALEYAFIRRHDILTDSVRRLTFEDGTMLYVNYGDSKFCEGHTDIHKRPEYPSLPFSIGRCL